MKAPQPSLIVAGLERKEDVMGRTSYLKSSEKEGDERPFLNKLEFIGDLDEPGDSGVEDSSLLPNPGALGTS